MKKILTLIFLIFTLSGCETTTDPSRSDRGLTRLKPSSTTPTKFSQHALVIGNAGYDYAKLRNTINDATDIAKTLREIGFQVTLKTNLNQRDMDNAIRQFGQRLSKNQGVGLFYFSGHGARAEGKNYLLPIDNSRIGSEMDLQYYAISANKVLKTMQKAINHINILILDACRDNPYRGVSKTINRGLARMDSPSGSIIAFATASGQTASDVSQNNRNGLFTSYLIKGLKRAYQTHQRIDDVFMAVSDAVTQESGGKQEPWQQDSLKKPFCFGGCPDERLRLAAAAKQKAEAQQQAQQSAEIERLKQENALLAQKIKLEQQALLAAEQSEVQAKEKAKRLEELARLKREKEERERKAEAIRQQRLKAERQAEEAKRLADEKRRQEQDSRPGKVFRDNLNRGGLSPEMVVIPEGRFQMGDIQGGGESDEKPLHWVSIKSFAMSKYEVTVREFRQFVNATGYKTEAEKGDGCYTYNNGSWNKVRNANWRNPNFSQNDNHPVVCISWNDAMAYTKWLSQQTGKQYSLPSEAQWEYAARAGTKTARYWGNDADDACRYANVHDKTSKTENGFSWTHHNCTDGYAKTAPVGHFKPNAFGLFDMLGNVWEWTCSQYESKYSGQEILGKNNAKNDTRLSLRGGDWVGKPARVRSADRNRRASTDRIGCVGFRLARL